MRLCESHRQAKFPGGLFLRAVQRDESIDPRVSMKPESRSQMREVKRPGCCEGRDFAEQDAEIRRRIEQISTFRPALQCRPESAGTHARAAVDRRSLRRAELRHRRIVPGNDDRVARFGLSDDRGQSGLEVLN